MPTNGKRTRTRDWRDLAERASKETNPEKLVRFVEELCGVLELREAERHAKPTPKKGDTPPVGSVE